LENLDFGLLRCPSMGYEGESDEEILGDADYLYLGYAVRSQKDLDAYMDAYVAEEGNVEAFMALDEIVGPEGRLERLRSGLPDSDSIPLLIEWYNQHDFEGGHVLYLDGHIEYIADESKFPMTEAAFHVIHRGHDGVDKAACRKRLTTLGESLTSYSKNDGGRYPGLAAEHEPFLFDEEALAKLDIAFLRCPAYREEGESDGYILEDADYVYLGFAVGSQAEMDAYMKAYLAAEGDMKAFSAREALPGPKGDIARLQSDLPDPATIPVLVEWWAPHEPEGGHVLYLDGHVEYIVMEDKFPMTEAFFDALDPAWDASPLEEFLWWVVDELLDF
jgi:prepilin-type processing-associated H-X9-DG protein